MASYSTFQPDSKPWKVSVCTSANDLNVRAFINELSQKFPDLALDVQYYSLPYNDIDHFQFDGRDVGIMILCHSINNRRFAITDVMDAIYDRFLPKAANILGKDRICVIAHDFPPTKSLNDPDKYRNEMQIFENMQPTTFKMASEVMMAGKLDGPEPVELQEQQWKDLKSFIAKAARSPMLSHTVDIPCMPENVQGNRNFWMIFAIFLVVVLILALGLGLEIDSSPSFGSTTPHVIPITASSTTTSHSPAL